MWERINQAVIAGLSTAVPLTEKNSIKTEKNKYYLLNNE
jgi:hypothetical protein